jgi:hypothetical protein
MITDDDGWPKHESVSECLLLVLYLVLSFVSKQALLVFSGTFCMLLEISHFRCKYRLHYDTEILLGK